MAGRYTRRHAETAFAALAKEMHAEARWQLDYAPEYGGFVIQQRSDRGGLEHPLGHTRRSAREFYDVCWFAVHVLELAAAAGK